VKVLRHWGNFARITAAFFNEEGLFNERSLPISKTADFEQLKYEEYAKEFVFDDALVVPILKDAEKHFGIATAELMAYVKATGKRDDPLIRDALKCALAGPNFLKLINRSKSFGLESSSQILFPVFSVSAQ
jgi:hypothetical protein